MWTPERAIRVLAIAALTIGLCLGAWAWVRALPPEHSPFAELALERPQGWATRLQLVRIRAEPAACSAALARSRLRYDAIEDRAEGPGEACGFRNAVAITASAYPYSGAVRVSCPLAASLYLWEREVAAAASTWLESPVARIEMIGTYACRNIYGRREGRLSEHATANAIDIQGFRLENGRVVTVLGGWDGGGADAAFLRAVRDAGCRVFQAVLSPDYNAAHRDHLHLDMGRYSICS